MKKQLISGACFAFALAAAGASPYIAKVYEFRPAPGQFINELPEIDPADSPEEIIAKTEEQLCGDKMPGMISLGAFGGYVVFGFDHPVVNVAGEYDFRIYGNAFLSGNNGSSEPGIIMVAEDVNGNGIPDDPWYEIAGSEYHNDATVHDYRITYYKTPADHKPVPEGSAITDKEYIRWTDSTGATGYMEKNSYHGQSYWPEWIADNELSFTGTRLPDNAVDESGTGTSWNLKPFEWGYADNVQNNDDPGIKIDWAVNTDGTPAQLSRIHFIKVYTGVRQSCGWLGETSTEVTGAEDLHPDAQAGIAAADTGDLLMIAGSGAESLTLRAAADMEVSIFSLSGTLVDRLTLHAGDNYIGTASWTPGLYLIRGGGRTLKFVR